MSNDSLRNFGLLSTITSRGRLSLSVTDLPMETPAEGEKYRLDLTRPIDN